MVLYPDSNQYHNTLLIIEIVNTKFGSTTMSTTKSIYAMLLLL